MWANKALRKVDMQATFFDFCLSELHVRIVWTTLLTECSYRYGDWLTIIETKIGFNSPDTETPANSILCRVSALENRCPNAVVSIVRAVNAN